MEATQIRFATFLLDRIDAKLAVGDVDEIKLYVQELRAIVDGLDEQPVQRMRRAKKNSHQMQGGS